MMALLMCEKKFLVIWNSMAEQTNMVHILDQTEDFTSAAGILVMNLREPMEAKQAKVEQLVFFHVNLMDRTSKLKAKEVLTL